MAIVKYIKKGLKQLLVILIIVSITLLVVRVFHSKQNDSLSLWHTVTLTELNAQQIDQSTWDDYILAENKVFDEVKNKITDHLSLPERVVYNRFIANSPVNPNQFEINWNHSFIMQPEGKALGAVVLLHGLTDSPYDLRHIALNYQAKGFVVVCIRMPAHGTAPAALTTIKWEDWLAATRLAVRTASSYIEESQPLHFVGFSNGGALALMYSVDALSNNDIRTADQIILIGPMIGISPLAKYANLFELPAILPFLESASWVDIHPEYNPFKYNSFPVNAGRQSYQLTTTLHKNIVSTNEKKLANLPPILTFLSASDVTVQNQAVVDLYQRLNNNGNELVIFDVNHHRDIAPWLSDEAYYATTELLPVSPRNYKTIVVTNENENSWQTVALITPASQIETKIELLHVTYPSHIYALSHIALPFPETDSLYGNQLNNNEFGINLGSLAIRTERNSLVIPLDKLLRTSYNPFYSFFIAQINDKIEASVTKKMD